MRSMRGFAAATVVLVAMAGCTLQTAGRRKQAAVNYYVQSQLQIDEGDDAAALRALLLAIDADPKLSTAHAAIGDIYRKRGDYDSAVIAYERAVDVNAWNFRNHYNCASLHQHLAGAGGGAEATETHLNRAVVLYSRAMVLNDTDYDSPLNLAVCYFQLTDYDSAEIFCRKAIELDDSMPHAYTNLGAVLDRKGKNYEAIEMYNKSLERDSRQPMVLMNLGAAYRRVDKLTSAIRSYQQALELEPGSAEALERLGFCHFFKGDYDTALQFYEAAIQADSRLAVAHRGIGIVYMAQYLKDRRKTELREKAVEHWRISLEIDPNQDTLADLVNKYAND